MPPLEVEYKPLWQPENVARAFGPIRVSRTLDRMPLRWSCLSAGEQLSFIRRIASGFGTAERLGCKWLKTPCRFGQKNCDARSVGPKLFLPVRLRSLRPFTGVVSQA